MPPTTRYNPAADADADANGLLRHLVQLVEDHQRRVNTDRQAIRNLWEQLLRAYDREYGRKQRATVPFATWLVNNTQRDACQAVLQEVFSPVNDTNKAVSLLRRATDKLGVTIWYVYLYFDMTVACSERALRQICAFLDQEPRPTITYTFEMVDQERAARLGDRYRPGFNPSIKLANVMAGTSPGQLHCPTSVPLCLSTRMILFLARTNHHLW